MRNHQTIESKVTILPEIYPKSDEQLSFEGMSEIQNEPEEFEYRILKGHTRTNGSFKSDEALKTEYVRLTDDLIHRITEGIKVEDPDTGEVENKPTDYVIWLDKSARPLSWLTKELWPQLAADKDGNIPAEPEHRFVNIDRNQWASSIDPDGTGITNVGSLDQSIIRSLRSVFLENPNDRAEGLTEHIDEAPAQLDGKQAIIVDEVRSTGRTLTYAKKMFERAFPTANIDTAYWMDETVTLPNGAVGNADLPVWYNDTTETGRGIGNRNIDRSRKSKNRTQRLGAWFLSTGLQRPDPDSTQLRREIHQLADDVKERRILIEPGRTRDEDDYDERVMRFNDVKNLKEFTDKRKAL